MQQLHVTGIKEFETLAQRIDGTISLSQGVLKAGGIPQQIKEYLAQILKSDKADYYENAELLTQLKEKISQILLHRYGVLVPTKQILITHGAIGGLSVVLQTILAAGDEVLLPEPTYPVYQNTITLAKGLPRFVRSRASGKGLLSWQFDIDAIKQATTEKTKAILFSNPVNPLGIIIPKETLEELVAWCEEKKVYLIADEVYEDYVFAGEFYSSVHFIAHSPWVIRASSFSKSFAMSGWRIGYVILPDHLTTPCDLTQHALIICPNALAQWAAIYALDHPELQKNFREIIETNKELAVSMLLPLAEKKKISFAPPTAGFFLFIQTNVESSKLCMSLLNQARVALVPGNTFGPTGKHFVRLCYARPTAVVQEGLNRIVNFFSR